MHRMHGIEEAPCFVVKKKEHPLNPVYPCYICGGRLNRWAPKDKFAQWVQVLLLLIGALLLVRSLRGHG